MARDESFKKQELKQKGKGKGTIKENYPSNSEVSRERHQQNANIKYFSIS